MPCHAPCSPRAASSESTSSSSSSSRSPALTSHALVPRASGASRLACAAALAALSVSLCMVA
eukprot:scaffold19984_cov127-Isochrysis_galbana.AAC.8